MKEEEYAKEYLNLRYSARKMYLDNALQKAATGEEYVLNFLTFRHAPVFPKELSDGMQTSTARVAAILRHLEQQKLIEITPDGDDGRRHSVRLSEEGEILARETRQRHLDQMTEIFRRIGEEETKEFIRITEHILEVCGKMGEIT